MPNTAIVLTPSSMLSFDDKTPRLERYLTAITEYSLGSITPLLEELNSEIYIELEKYDPSIEKAKVAKGKNEIEKFVEHTLTILAIKPVLYNYINLFNAVESSTVLAIKTNSDWDTPLGLKSTNSKFRILNKIREAAWPALLAELKEIRAGNDTNTNKTQRLLQRITSAQELDLFTLNLTNWPAFFQNDKKDVLTKMEEKVRYPFGKPESIETSYFRENVHLFVT